MENYIKKISTIIIPCIDHIQLVDYKDEELDFVYGMEEYHTSFRRMFKQIIRILWR
jgi:hypothetical protein